LSKPADVVREQLWVLIEDSALEVRVDRSCELGNSWTSSRPFWLIIIGS
jgi:hypothetical protein